MNYSEIYLLARTTGLTELIAAMNRNKLFMINCCTIPGIRNATLSKREFMLKNKHELPLRFYKKQKIMEFRLIFLHAAQFLLLHFKLFYEVNLYGSQFILRTLLKLVVFCIGLLLSQLGGNTPCMC